MSAYAGVDKSVKKIMSDKSYVSVYAGVDKLVKNITADKSFVSANAGVDELGSEMQLFEDVSEAVITSMTVDPKSKKIVLKLSARSKVTNHDEWVLIYDTASTVHLFKNLLRFDGVSGSVDDDEVSFCGFNTNQDQAFPVAEGTLKFPFAGIKAYYNPTTVGNIVSESLLAKSHHISERRYDNSALDTITASRRHGNWSENLYWSRGIEGIFVTNIGFRSNYRAYGTQ